MFFGGFESSKEHYEVKKNIWKLKEHSKAQKKFWKIQEFSGRLYFITREWLLDDHDEIEQSYHTGVD